jgi:ATP-binding cassette, subfamily F, member 3
LERALQEFQGTTAFITHDRHLINAIANKIVEVNAGSLTEYLGNFDDYLYKKALENKTEKPEEDPAVLSGKMGAKDRSARKDKEQKRIEAEARNRFYRETKDLRERIEEIEGHLEAANQEMELTAAQLADPEVYRRGEKITELLKNHAAVKKRVEELTSEWEDLAQKLEDLGAEPSAPSLNGD